MTIVFGSPEAWAVIQADRKLAKEEAEREKAEAAFGGEPLKMWTVLARAWVTCRVAAPDEETAEELAEWLDEWEYSAEVDPNSITVDGCDDGEPPQWAVDRATKWAERRGGGAA